MYENPFVLDRSQYQRDLNVRTHYVHDTALYLSKMTDKPVEQCKEFVIKSLQPGGRFEFKDPDVYYLERGDNGDRKKKVGKMTQYLAETIQGMHLIAPTFTTYLPPHVKKALLVDYIDANVKARGVAKKAMFKAEMAGDTLTATTKKIEQNYKKINNNSISGAHVSPSTPLYNPTGHSTLTSVCRSTSGYGNANNEKFLCGNRHYWSPEITLNNIVSIIGHSDYDAIAKVMEKYGIRHPTAEETMECITYSTDLYWDTPKEMEKIKRLVYKLTDLERSAFVYTGDLFHLMKYNDSVVRTFIMRLSEMITAPHSDPEAALKGAPEEHQHLAAQICSTEMKGVSLDKAGLDKIRGTPTFNNFAATSQNVGKVLTDYRDLIRAFWVTTNVPASVASLPASIRRAAITSDTDSTIFTVQDWVKWYCGKIVFNPISKAVSATMIFLAAQTITHLLARMSANFGIESSRLFQIAMKNEYAFDVFVATQVAKHYYAYIGCQEGNLFKKHKKEIKGVHLKSSKAPKAIMKKAEDMMIRIMETVMANELVDLQALIKEVADIERSVYDAIRRGSPEYFSFAQIKTPDSYAKSEMESNFYHYLFWDEVFAPKYGKIEYPPYTSVKISTDLKSPTELKKWIDGFTDPEMKQRMQAWIEKTGRKNMTTFQLPEPIISTGGIPEEIFQVIDSRKIVLETTKVFYLILETLGYMKLNDNITQLVSDFY